MQRAAVGLVPHTGWTWLVHVGADDAVEARERIVAIEVQGAELYHLTRDHDGDRAKFFAAKRDLARARTIEAIRGAVAGATVAVVLGKSPSLPALEAIVRSHAMIHAAEGDLWRALFAEACRACGLAATRAAMPVKPMRDDARFLAQGKLRVGSPWTKEIQEAARAARAAVA